MILQVYITVNHQNQQKHLKIITIYLQKYMIWLTFLLRLGKMKVFYIDFTFKKLKGLCMKKLSLPPTERRRLTRNQIYQYIYKAPGCSKQEIADSLNFSMPTIHQNLNELTQAGLVRIDGVGESTGGRRPLQLTINENARFSLGVSVTESHFRIVAANLRLDEIAYQKYGHPHCNNMKDLGSFLTADLEDFLNRFGLNREKLLGIGIALPAIFNADRTCVITAPTLDLRDQDIHPLICSIPYPVAVCNDATSGGYAEWYVQQDSDCMAYISLEGGVGGAILVNGVPYTGLNGRSGEFGHICVQPEGLSCKCGLRGCLEAYCSSDRISTDLGISVEQFFAGLEAGNLAYQTLWKDYLRHLASALATIRMMFDCRIVLGGYVAQYLTPFLKELRGLTASRDPFDDEAEYISLCHYPKHAVPLGAALHFINLFVEEL